MEEHKIIPFLDLEDENLQFLYDECEKVYDRVFVSWVEIHHLVREEQHDVYALLQRLDRNLTDEGRSLIDQYYTEASFFLDRARSLVPVERQDLQWLLTSINDLDQSGNRDNTLHALCFFHNAVKSIFQYCGLCISGKTYEIKRTLVETACSHLGQSPDNILTDAVKYALALPAGLLQISSAIWQGISHSYDIASDSIRHGRIAYPSGLSMGISLADLAYASTNGNVDGLIIKEIDPISIKVGKHTLSGEIDLPGNLRAVLCSYRHYRNRVIVCFRGTINLRNWLTNITQFAICDDYVYHMALGLVLLLAVQYKEDNIDIYGHSLGGGLTQFSVIGADNPKISGTGYNSAGLSNLTLARMKAPQNRINMTHFHLRNDVVFNIGHHIGDTIHSFCYFDTGISKDRIKKIHSVEMLRVILGCNRYWKLK